MAERELDLVFARLQKAIETDDWCELKADECRTLLAAYEDRSKAFERAPADCVRLEGALRSTQDTLLHKVPRNEAVLQQLEVNRAALSPADPEDEQHAHAEHLREAREHQEEKHGE